MFSIRELNVSLELWGVAFSVVGLVCSLLLTRFQNDYRKTFAALFALNIVSEGGDAMAGICRGESGELAWIGTHVGNLSTFVAGFLLVAVLTMYLHNRMKETKAPLPTIWLKCVTYSSVLMCLFAALNMFYHIDENNLYHRSNLYWVSGAYIVAVFLVNAMFVLRNWRSLDAFSLFCMLFYTLSPAVSACIQVTVYGINFLAISSTLGLILIFMEMQVSSAAMYAERTKELAQSEVQLAESRMTAMVSQIQPHFIFNTLDTIYGLCDEDVERAKEAIASFSRYLRTNLASLRQTVPVPIATEIQHVRTYLELERMADKNRLQYVLDVRVTGFLVPALSVQTLVENAVKHGLGGREEGGLVTVSTHELADEFTVHIVDDGVGFNTNAILNNMDSTHVGILNTKARLATMCNGSLDIVSTPNEGTTVTIRIPKGGAK
ncbi:MAG: histidine kinase [Atopobiaceae bacterium]|nr:histidine kinase [Atopobiaceae bacterium]